MSPEPKRLVSPMLQNQNDDRQEVNLRPQDLSEYIGQNDIIDNLSVYMEAAKKREEPLDHVLLSGPPGLGKTTLANLIAKHMGGRLKTSSGPAIERPVDLLVLLTSLREGDVLFIDEIHRMNRNIEEILYPAMEDGCFDRILSKGVRQGTTKHRLAPFTLVGATTKSGMLSSPLRSRFGILFHLKFYSDTELAQIVTRSAKLLDFPIEEKAALEIARRCRGTPRIANRLLRRVRDFSEVKEEPRITLEITRHALTRMGVDKLGLDELDRQILTYLVDTHKGRPVGLSTLAAGVQQDAENIEQVYEPFLLAQGFLERTPRGRVATMKAFHHLGVSHPSEESSRE